MSGFLDNLGKAVETVGKVAKTGWDAVTPLAAIGGFAADLATAPWNDSEDYNGFLNTLESRGFARLGQALHPLDVLVGGHGGEILHDVGAVSRQIYTNGISRPAVTVLGTFGTSGEQSHGLNVIANWKDAWRTSRDVSPGQMATAGIIGGTLGGVNALGVPTPALGGLARPGFDLNSEEDRAVFRHGPAKLISGAVDATLLWNADPLVLTGKAIGAARRGAVVKPIKGSAGAAKAAESSRVGGFLDTLMAHPDYASRVEWLSRNPAISGPRAADDGSALMHLLAQSESHDEARDVLRYAMDPNLRNGEVLNHAAADLKAQADHIRDVRIPSLEALLVDEVRIDDWGARAVQMDVRMRVAEANANMAVMREAAQYNQFLARASSSVRNTPRIALPQRLDAAQSGLTGVTWAAYQPSRYNVPMRVLKSASTMRAGVIDRNRPSDGYIQLKRMLDRAGHGFETKAIHRERANRLGFATRAGGIDEAEKGRLLGAWMQATDETAQNAAVLAAEKAVVLHYAQRLGLDTEQATEIINTAQYQRGQAQTYFSSDRAYTGARDADGNLIDHLDSTSGVGTGNAVALLETQLANHFPLIDVDEIGRIMADSQAELLADAGGLTARIRAARGDLANSPARDVAGLPEITSRTGRTASGITRFGRQGGDEVLTRFNRVWKPAQLMRLGWTIRVITDEQLRIMATIGAMAHLPLVAHSLMRPNAHEAGEVATARAQLEDLERRIAKRAENKGKGPTVEQEALRAELTKATKGRRANRAAKFSGTLTDRDMRGRKVKYDDAFGGEQGVIAASLSSSTGNLDRQSRLAGAFGELAGTNGRYQNALRATAGRPTTILPMPSTIVSVAERKAHAALYATSWERAVNDQIAQSEIGRRILEGWSNERIVAWLKHSPEGRSLRERIPVRGSRPDRWVSEVRQHVDHYLPNDELRKLALGGRARFTHLESAIPDVGLRPEIHGESLATTLGTSAIGQQWDKMISGYYRRFGATPTNVLSRHPHFAALYRNEMAAQIHAYPLGAKERISPEAIEKMQRRARERALQGVRHTLYDLSNSSNLAHTFRYISPFYSAWQEALTRWGGLFMEDPSRLARMVQVWEAPSRAGLVETDPDTGRQTIVVNPPDWLVPEAIEGPVGIPKYWMRDLVAQGTYWMTPGVGVPVALPIAHLIRDRPDLYDNIRSVLPYGPGADDLDVLLPAAGRRARSLYTKDDDAAYAQAKVRIAQDLEVDRQIARSHGEPGMTDAQLQIETTRRTNSFFAIRMVANLALPFSPGFRSPYDGYVQMARNYRDTYLAYPGGKDPEGKNWEEKYLEDAGPDYFAFTAAASKNNTGVAPTVGAYEASKRYGDLIAQAPELGALIVGPQAQAGEFSSEVYHAQFDQSVGPGSGQKVREQLSPQEALDRAQIDQGWGEYLRMSKLINKELVDRGLAGGPKTLGANANRDLALLKRNLTAKMAERYPAWNEDRNTINLDPTGKVIGFLGANIDDPRFADRPGFATLKLYLKARQEFSGLLEARYAQGGDSTLGAQSNADVAAVWNAMVANWKEKDVEFETIWDRWLERDLGQKPQDQTGAAA